MINVLVTGSNGQLGSCIKDLAFKQSNINFIYTDYLELDICNLDKVYAFFESHKDIHYCINCAAYTAVDKAEKENERAYKINVIGAKYLALACKIHKAILIHVSTDFVFDGLSSKPYVEKDDANPISVYGSTKLQGELEVKRILKQHFIIRTSWLYSEYGNNFMKTMLRLSETRSEMSIVRDQMGTPTYAGDLAEVIIHIITTKPQNFGIYHYSNSGEISWYDFAKAIFEETNTKIDINPIKTEEYPTPAKRPQYSVLNKSKIEKNLKVETSYWRDSLVRALQKLN